MSGSARIRTCAACGCTEAAACHDDLRGACWWVGDRICSHCAEPDARRTLARVAAERLAAVVDELLRFAREGDQESFQAFALEPAEATADALRAILRIQNLPRALPNGGLTEPDEDANQLIGALDRFLEGWA